MSLFYFDEKIQYYEKRLEYSPIIEYLEDIYNSTNDSKIFITLIACSWYYMIEGDVNQNPINYNWEFFQFKLKYYIDIGLKNYTNNERFDYVAGYILYLHWIYLGGEYEGIGWKLIQKCSEISKDRNIKILALHFLKQNKLSDVNLIKILFPSKSELDQYFRLILSSEL